MERIIGTNERMLLVIDQISSELSTLKTNEIAEKGARIAEEIEELFGHVASLFYAGSTESAGLDDSFVDVAFG